MDWHFDIDEVVTFESFMPRQELQATRMFREYLAPRGWHDFVLTILEKSSSRVTSFGFIRHAREGAFGEAELELMRLIAPHVRRAVALGGIIARQTARAEDLAAVFARLAMPAFLLDAEGRCLEPNGAALQLLGRALHPAGRLASGGRVARGRAWGGVLMGLGSVAAPASVPLIDDEGHAFVAHVVPLSGADRVVIAGGGRAEAAVFVQQVGGLAPLPGEVLVKLYGLTPAETRLLALLGRGLSVEEAADALGVTMATARTHLARVFDKTGTRRQAELVRLVMSAFPAPLG
jgi:DNA-binding CsgD family transcriptional regulator